MNSNGATDDNWMGQETLAPAPKLQRWVWGALAGASRQAPNPEISLFLLADGAISWKSAKQSVIATSTMEAEFVAYYEATIHALWLRNFIPGLGVVDTITKPLKIYCDNTAAIFFSKNDKYSKGAKHMELKYFTVKEEVQKQRVLFENIRTDLMIADPLTKGLQPKTFKKHVQRMGLGCTYD
ncbi:hypothetical protein KY290_005415 [Solanum tuberosum]|uniref:Uncharacterized protein n=1 Tax=Solanum tuberosum TaxID=4113 RepID=A0ABQ7WE30_SOLTU|nr:hypothetical protein KY289_005810 [Solanum tuberosum]KAH0778988.1 hypothetical protein KY290_005415 [Solanum tuberosum]